MKINQNLASPYVSESGPTVGLHVSVNDEEIRKIDPNYNGLEKVFALVPFEEGGQVQWKRVDLEYQGTHWNRGSPVASDDHFKYVGLRDTDKPNLHSLGVAFGLEYDGQDGKKTIWCQTIDDNYKPY